MKETAAKRAFQILLEVAKEGRVEAPAMLLQFHGFSSSQASSVLTQLEKKGLIEKIYWARGSGRGIAKIRILKEEFPESLPRKKKSAKIEPEKITKPVIQITPPPPPPEIKKEEQKKEKPLSLRRALRLIQRERRKEAKERGKNAEERVSSRLNLLQKEAKIQRWWKSIPFSATDVKKKIDFCVAFLNGFEANFQIKSSEYFAKKHRERSNIPVIVVNNQISDKEIDEKILELSQEVML